MGWKKVKEHFGIGHIVHVRDGKITVGSPYISEIFAVDNTGKIEWVCALSRRHGDALDRYILAMEADPETLVRLISEPDDFGPLQKVFTYDEDRILEKQCEEFGFPNITTDGELMYDNLHFASRKDAVSHAKRNAAAVISNIKDNVDRREAELASMKADLEHWRGVADRLEAAS